MPYLVTRRLWIEQIKQAWQSKNVIWLTGVRRVGKTSLCNSLAEEFDFEYFDCELNRTRNFIEADVEGFLQGLQKSIIIFDEIHRLENPSEILKVIADHYPQLQVIATGSSTFGASKKFKDTLTDRKVRIRLCPLTLQDLEDFEAQDYGSSKNLDHRFLFGGLPPFYLSKEFPESAFQEWVDSYFAKEVQELFAVRDRSAFQKFMSLLFVQSGGMFEASSFTSACGVTVPTISSYLNILKETFVVEVLKPFASNPSKEIVSAPKVYAFDTGLIAYYSNWINIRDKDRGIMWEHFVLNELVAQLQYKEINYWRDKKKREVDFVLRKRGVEGVIAIEAKWNSAKFEPGNLQAFRALHPEGPNYVVAHDVDRSYTKSFGDLELRFVNLKQLVAELI